MKTEHIELVSVKDGKYHRLENPEITYDGRPFWTPRMMACGRSLEPHNFFETAEDANRYTGGRLEKYICKHCVAAQQKPAETL